MFSFVSRARCLPSIEDSFFSNIAQANYVLGMCPYCIFLFNPFPARVNLYALDLTPHSSGSAPPELCDYCVLLKSPNTKCASKASSSGTADSGRARRCTSHPGSRALTSVDCATLRSPLGTIHSLFPPTTRACCFCLPITATHRQ